MNPPTPTTSSNPEREFDIAQTKFSSLKTIPMAFKLSSFNL
jgi:hypothetical protein